MSKEKHIYPDAVKRLWPLGIFILATVIFFWPVFFKGQVFSGADMLLRGYSPWMALQVPLSHAKPQNGELSDPVFSFVPNLMYCVKVMRSGEVPLWNVLKMCGMPQLADGTTPVFFPLNVLYLTGLHPLASGTIKIIIEILLMGLFCYLLGRKWKLDETGSLAAALIVVFSPVMVGWLEFYMFLDARMWYPAVFLCYENYIEKGKGRGLYLFCGALSLGFMMLSLSPKDISYFVQFFFAYSLVRSLVIAKGRSEKTNIFLKSLFFFAIVGLLGGGLGAIQTMPLLEFSKYCARTAVSLRWIAPEEVWRNIHDAMFLPQLWYKHFDAPWRLISLFSFVLPKFFGAAQDGVFWTINPYIEINYMGILPLVLGISTLSWKEKRTVFFFWTAVICYFLWAGLPILTEFYDFITLGAMQGKGLMRVKFIMGFCLAYLAGLSITRLNARQDSAYKGTLKYGQLISGALAVLAAVVFFIMLFWPQTTYEFFRQTQFLGIDRGMEGTQTEAVSIFPSKREFFSYQVVQFTLLFLMALSSWFYLHWTQMRKFSPKFRNGFCLAIIFIDLFAFGHNSNPTIRLSEAYPPLKSVDFLKKEDSFYRIYRYGTQNVLTSGAVNTYGIYDAGGRAMSLYVKRSADLLAMIPKKKEFLSGLYPSFFKDPAGFESKLPDLLNIKYIISPRVPPTLSSFEDPRMKSIFNFYDRFAEAQVTAPQKNFVSLDHFSINGDARNVILENPSSEVAYEVTVPEKGKLMFGIGINPYSWRPLPGGLRGYLMRFIFPERLLRSNGMVFKIFVKEADREKKLLFAKFLDPRSSGADRRWFDFELDLAPFAGKNVRFLFTTEPGPEDNSVCDWGGWSRPALICQQPEGELSSVEKKYPLVWQGEGLYIYENKEVLPRAFVVYNSRIMTDEATEAEIRSDAFDPRKFVILAQGKQLNGNDASVQSANITEYGANRLKIKVKNEKPGYLVVSDTYYPGWKAFVDGREETIERAYYSLRAVHLDAGDHEVVMKYEPFSYILGKRLSFGSLLIFFIWACVLIVRKKVRKKVLDGRQ